jgi:hypothetical protein
MINLVNPISKVKDRETKGDSTREVGDHFSLSLQRIIEESTSATADPWYAFVSLWRLMTYSILYYTILYIKLEYNFFKGPTFFQGLTSYNMLKGLSRGNFLTSLKPASSQYFFTIEGGIPRVPRPSPPSASDVVIQYITLQP